MFQNCHLPLGGSFLKETAVICCKGLDSGLVRTYTYSRREGRAVEVEIRVKDGKLEIDGNPAEAGDCRFGDIRIDVEEIEPGVFILYSFNIFVGYVVRNGRESRRVTI